MHKSRRQVEEALASYTTLAAVLGNVEQGADFTASRQSQLQHAGFELLDIPTEEERQQQQQQQQQEEAAGNTASLAAAKALKEWMPLSARSGSGMPSQGQQAQARARARALLRREARAVNPYQALQATTRLAHTAPLRGRHSAPAQLEQLASRPQSVAATKGMQRPRKQQQVLAQGSRKQARKQKQKQKKQKLNKSAEVQPRWAHRPDSRTTTKLPQVHSRAGAADPQRQSTSMWTGSSIIAMSRTAPVGSINSSSMLPAGSPASSAASLADIEVGALPGYTDLYSLLKQGASKHKRRKARGKSKAGLRHTSPAGGFASATAAYSATAAMTPPQPLFADPVAPQHRLQPHRAMDAVGALAAKPVAVHQAPLPEPGTSSGDESSVHASDNEDSGSDKEGGDAQAADDAALLEAELERQKAAAAAAARAAAPSDASFISRSLSQYEDEVPPENRLVLLPAGPKLGIRLESTTDSWEDEEAEPITRHQPPSLSKKRAKLLKEAAAIKQAQEESILKTRETLPFDFLFQQKVKEFKKNRSDGDALLRRIFKRLLNQYTLAAWNHWVDTIHDAARLEREALEHSAATVVARIARGWLARRAVRRLRALRRQQAKDAARNQRKTTRRAARKIQMMVRRHQARQRLRDLKRRDNAAKVIQRTWARHKNQAAAMIILIARQRRINCATRIQATFRGFVGRKDAAEWARQVKREEIDKRLQDPEYVITLVFREKGAAIVIQKWWKHRLRYPRPCKLDPMVKFHLAAREIQRVWRGHRDRAGPIAELRRQAAATKIQKFMRAWRDRRMVAAAAAVAAAGGTADDLEAMRDGTITRERLGQFTSLVKTPFKGLRGTINHARGTVLKKGVLGSLFKKKKKKLTKDEAGVKIKTWYVRIWPDYCRRRDAANQMRKIMKGFLTRKWWAKERFTRRHAKDVRVWYFARRVQQMWRGSRVRRSVRRLINQNKLAKHVQRIGRGYVVRRKLGRAKRFVVFEQRVHLHLQALVRGWLARRHVDELKEHLRVRREQDHAVHSYMPFFALSISYAAILDGVFGEGFAAQYTGLDDVKDYELYALPSNEAARRSPAKQNRARRRSILAQAAKAQEAATKAADGSKAGDDASKPNDPDGPLSATAWPFPEPESVGWNKKMVPEPERSLDKKAAPAKHTSVWVFANYPMFSTIPPSRPLLMLWEYLTARVKYNMQAIRDIDTTFKKKRRKSLVDACAVGVDSTTLVKFVRDTPNMQQPGKDLTTSLDLIHAKRRAKGARGLTPEEFGHALRDIARLRLPHVESYRKAKGEAAQVLSLLYNYLLQGPEAHDFMVSLHRYSMRVLHGAAYVIQRWQRRRKTKQLALTDIAMARAQILHAAARRIQSLIRMQRARKAAAVVAQDVWQKFIDPHTGAPYFHNPRTGTRSWEAPAVLRGLDVARTIKLPPPDQDMTAMCGYCDELVAARECYDCDDVYCKECCERFHKREDRREHRIYRLLICAECEFQAASRRCIECGDPFCDNCFAMLHQSGRFQSHAFKVLAVPCIQCFERSARGHCVDCQNGDMQTAWNNEAMALTEKVVEEASKAGKLNAKRFVKRLIDKPQLPPDSDEEEEAVAQAQAEQARKQKTKKPAVGKQGKKGKKGKKEDKPVSLLDAYKNKPTMRGVRKATDDEWGGYNWNRSVGRYCSEDCYDTAHAAMAAAGQDAYSHYFEPFAATKPFFTVASADIQALQTVEAWALQYARDELRTRHYAKRDAKNAKLGGAALKIQKVWRGYAGRKLGRGIMELRRSELRAKFDAKRAKEAANKRKDLLKTLTGQKAREKAEAYRKKALKQAKKRIKKTKKAIKKSNLGKQMRNATTAMKGGGADMGDALKEMKKAKGSAPLYDADETFF